MSSNVLLPIKPRMARPARARGFSLLEVLVAIVVLSFGVLGVVGLQAASMQANTEARYQSAAARYGRELSDMMRDNKTVALTQTTDPSVNPYIIDSSVAPPAAPPTNCSTSACTDPMQLAKFQIYEWYKRASNELPGARIAVCFDKAPYTNGIPVWTCTSPGAPPAGTTPSPNLVVVKLGWTRVSTNRSATLTTALDRAQAPAVVLPFNPGSPS